MYYFKFLIPYSLFLALALVAPMAHAARTADPGISGAIDYVEIFGRKAFGVEAPGIPDVPIEVVAGKIIQGAMALIGVAFGILIIYGGFLWMTARGNEETVKKSINILQTAVIGFIIVVGAYAITNYVVDIVITSAFRP